VSFVDSLVRDRVLRFGLANAFGRLLGGVLGKIWSIIGALLGLFVAGYTGVLLAVSNQPVWSDSWALGGLFLASALSGSAALLWWLTRFRADAQSSAQAFGASERVYPILELVLIVVFVLTLIPAGTLGRAFGFPWTLLWIVALAGLLPGLGGLFTTRLSATREGGVVVQNGRAAAAFLVTGLVLVGVLALRAAVIFSAQ
jgi:formate-dependent nitrite reductase membrane component NrfD